MAPDEVAGRFAQLLATIARLTRNDALLSTAKSGHRRWTLQPRDSRTDQKHVDDIIAWLKEN